MILLLLALLGPAAHAKDLTVCATIAGVVSRFEDENEQAQFAAQNAETVCEESSDKATCKKQLEERAVSAQKFLDDAKRIYREAGCEE
jgi:hypothetical protein